MSYKIENSLATMHGFCSNLAHIYCDTFATSPEKIITVA